MQDKITKTDWFNTAVNSLKDKLDFNISLYGNNELAIAKTKQESCAGSAIWAEVLK